MLDNAKTTTANLARPLAAMAPNHGICCQCGKEPDEESVPERSVERATARQTCRNGTESLKTLPLRKDVESVTEDY